MKNKSLFRLTLAAWTIALPAMGAILLTGCSNDEITDTVKTSQTRTVTFTAVAPEGANSRALWQDNISTTGKLGFRWEDTDDNIDLFWVAATNTLQRDATLSSHSGTSVTVTGTAPEGEFTQVIALFPAGTIQANNTELYRTLPTTLIQKGSTTDHLRNYMYLKGSLTADEVTDGTATMQLTHGCAVLRFNVKNGGTSDVRVTKVEMLAAGGKTGVNTRAAITSESANNGGALTYSEPGNISVNVQDATDATKGHLLAAKNGETIESLSVYAHCFPTHISDGQFLFLVTVTDDSGENEKTYITKEAFSASGITTTSDTDNNQKMFKAGYYYTFNLDIASENRFEEFKDYTTETVDGITTYKVNTYAGLQAWREAVMNANGRVNKINLTLGMDITLPATTANGTAINVDENGVPSGSNWTPIGTSNNPFTGTINGGGHTITGLRINSSSENQGFIGFLGIGGIVKNLTFADAHVTVGKNSGIVVSANQGTIENCHVTSGSSLTANDNNAGGIVGVNILTNTSHAIVINCTNAATIAAAQGTDAGSLGGIAGLSQGSILGCINTGVISSADYNIGGIVGDNYGIVVACSNKGAVTGIGNVGGIVGSSAQSTAQTIGSWTILTNESDNSSDGIGDNSLNGSISGCFTGDAATIADAITAMNAAIATYNDSAVEGKTCPYTWQAGTDGYPTLVKSE